MATALDALLGGRDLLSCARRCRQAFSEPEKRGAVDGPGRGDVKNKAFNFVTPNSHPWEPPLPCWLAYQNRQDVGPWATLRTEREEWDVSPSAYLEKKKKSLCLNVEGTTKRAV